MNTSIKKTPLFMIIFGLIVLGVSLYFGIKEYQILNTGTNVSGTVTRIITLNNDDGPTYKPEISYRHNNQDKIYIPNYSSSSNNKIVDDSVELIVSPKGTRIKGINAGNIALIISFFVGLVFSLVGLFWLKKHQKHFDEVARLKRHGTRVQARFVKQENSRLTINNTQGIILFFQEEDSNRVFNTKPIYSEFSIKWLEEHPFDVYVDPRNSSKYFIDIEKHFGHPQPYK